MSEQRPADEESANRDHIPMHIDDEWLSALAEIRELAMNNASDPIDNHIRDFVGGYGRHLRRWHEATGTLNRMPEWLRDSGVIDQAAADGRSTSSDHSTSDDEPLAARRSRMIAGELAKSSQLSRSCPATEANVPTTTPGVPRLLMPLSQSYPGNDNPQLKEPTDVDDSEDHLFLFEHPMNSSLGLRHKDQSRMYVLPAPKAIEYSSELEWLLRIEEDDELISYIDSRRYYRPKAHQKKFLKERAVDVRKMVKKSVESGDISSFKVARMDKERFWKALGSWWSFVVRAEARAATWYEREFAAIVGYYLGADAFLNELYSYKFTHLKRPDENDEEYKKLKVEVGY